MGHPALACCWLMRSVFGNKISRSRLDEHGQAVEKYGISISQEPRHFGIAQRAGGTPPLQPAGPFDSAQGRLPALRFSPYNQALGLL